MGLVKADSHSVFRLCKSQEKEAMKSEYFTRTFNLKSELEGKYLSGGKERGHGSNRSQSLAV